MRKNTLISVLLFIFFISCKNGDIKIDKLQIQNNFSNRDHVIALANNSICYAIFQNFRKYTIYIFDKNSSLVQTKSMLFIDNHKKNKISKGMDKRTVISILGEPAIEDGNRYIYFQEYFDFNFINISYGIDRRIIELVFENEILVNFEEKYVSVS